MSFLGINWGQALATVGDVFGATIGDPGLGHQALGIYNAVTGSANNATGTAAQTQAQNAADPFAPYRGAMGQAYSQAMSQGSTVDPTKMPGYDQWMSGVLNPALGTVQGRMGASGLSLSGTEQAGLMKTAQQGYYGFMTDYLNRLAQGSGAVNNPAPAAQLGIQQGNLQNQATMQGAGALATAVPGLLSQGLGGIQGAFSQTSLGSSGFGSGLAYGMEDLGSYFSDVRLKTNIKKVGENEDGLGIYKYRYIWGGPEMLGYMAQEVQQVKPQAVKSGPNGYLMVDYSKV